MGSSKKKSPTEEEEEPEDVVEANKEDDNSENGDEGEEDDKQQKRRRKRKRKRKNDKSEEEDKDAGKEETSTADPALDHSDAQKKTREVDRTVYMEGIPFSASREHVIAFFTSNGISDDKLTDVRLPVWQDSGRLRGYGHIVLATDTDYQAALALNRKYMGQRYVTIQAAQAPKASSFEGATGQLVDPNINPSRTLILNNLSYDASEDDIQAMFEELYPNKELDIAEGGIRVVRHSHTGRSKGFAYVEFVKQEDAIQVVQNVQNRQKLLIVCHRACRVDYDHGRVRGSFRTADRKLWHKEYNNSNQSSNYNHGSNDGKRQRS